MWVLADTIAPIVSIPFAAQASNTTVNATIHSTEAVWLYCSLRNANDAPLSAHTTLRLGAPWQAPAGVSYVQLRASGNSSVVACAAVDAFGNVADVAVSSVFIVGTTVRSSRCCHHLGVVSHAVARVLLGGRCGSPYAVRGRCRADGVRQGYITGHCQRAVHAALRNAERVVASPVDPRDSHQRHSPGTRGPQQWYIFSRLPCCRCVDESALHGR